MFGSQGVFIACRAIVEWHRGLLGDLASIRPVSQGAHIHRGELHQRSSCWACTPPRVGGEVLGVGHQILEDLPVELVDGLQSVGHTSTIETKTGSLLLVLGQGIDVAKES